MTEWSRLKMWLDFSQGMTFCPMILGLLDLILAPSTFLQASLLAGESDLRAFLSLFLRVSISESSQKFFVEILGESGPFSSMKLLFGLSSSNGTIWDLALDMSFLTSMYP